MSDGDPASFVDVEYFSQLARIAERGTLDGLFLADHHGGLTWGGGKRPWHALDPVTLLSALSMRTSAIGLIATQSALYGDPYTTARRIASLDHISSGRAAWNIVTSYDPTDSELFGFAPASGDRLVRYRQADEYVQVVTGLWRSLRGDALVGDKNSATFLDLSRVSPLDHVGPFYSVKGPLGIPPTPQVRPVLFHAGASAESQEFAARWADAFFTIQRTFASAQRLYSQVKNRARANGRNPDDVLVMPGLYVFVASTEEEAKRRKQTLDETEDIRIILERFARKIGLPADELDLDAELPYHLLEPSPPRPGVNVSNPDSREEQIIKTGVDIHKDKVPGSREQLIAQAKAQRATVRDLMTDAAGHLAVVGSPQQVADHIEKWFRGRAVDGYNIDIDLQPDGLEAFVDYVIPILRDRGVFRHEYTSGHLRDNLGLPAPRQ
jgi:FMN-dependent oxidoreductase (nitrilotriacetate monooxygenase family)